MAAEVLVDSSFLYALLSPLDRNRSAALAYLQSSRERFLIPIVTLPEVAHLLRYRVGQQAVINFLQRIVGQDFDVIQVENADLDRARQILTRYADADFDLVDGCIMALSERMKIVQVCTFDRRDFSIYRPEHTDYLELLP